MKKILIPLALLTLSACNPAMDMQGTDPRDYYKEHPIVNRVETRNKIANLHYEAGQSRLSPSEIDKLQNTLHPISMLAIESIEVSSAPSDKSNDERKLRLTKLLRSMGYSNGVYVFKSSSALKSGEVQLNIAYSVVVSPDCPDWRTSPVTTHSNTKQGNFSCASQVNLGLMVADPHDLVRGTGDMPIDTPSADKVLQDFHEPKGAGASASSSGGAPPATGGTTSAAPTSGQ